MVCKRRANAIENVGIIHRAPACNRVPNGPQAFPSADERFFSTEPLIPANPLEISLVDRVSINMPGSPRVVFFIIDIQN